ncbi:MAG: hypothetical protein NTU49_02585, partial [Gammaproteobacteria bacterium]|nr:hypothetical protein [Gammaproteobacteria bacterium]
NPSRSIAMAAFGSMSYSRSGFVVLDPSIDQIEMVYGDDADTGRAKKLKSGANNIKEKQLALEKLHQKLQMGGFSRNFNGITIAHNEITCHLDRYDAIYYTHDSRVFDRTLNKKTHPYIDILEAVFLRYEYQKQYEKTKHAFLQKWPEDGEHRFFMRFGKQAILPIVEYSGSHNFIRRVPEEILSEDKIIEMWETLAEEVIRTNIDCLWNCSIQTLRTYCTFDNAGRRIDLLAKENRDAASNYPPDLQDRINQKLLLIREMVLTEEKNVLRNELQQLSAQNFTMDSTEILLTKLLRHPEPLEENKEKITRLITPILKLSGNNFLNSCGKIFFLCQKLGLKEEEESIRQKIIPVIKEALALLYPDNWFHIYSFLHLYEQVNLFGLTDQFKIDFLDILVIEFLDASVKDVSRSCA